MVVLPGGGYSEHVAHEAEPIVRWVTGLGVRASVFRYPLLVRHPAPMNALRAEIRQLRAGGAERIGLIGFSAGGHLAGLAALAPGGGADDTVDFAVLGYAITSMETETYRPARMILLGEDATPQLRRETSLNTLVTGSSPPFFLWHTAEDPTSRLSTPTASRRLSPPMRSRTPPMSSPMVHIASGWRAAAATPAARTGLAASWMDEQRHGGAIPFRRRETA
jgi:acetyl esterase/lipase